MATTVKDAKAGEFSPVIYETFDDMDSAFMRAMQVYSSGEAIRDNVPVQIRWDLENICDHVVVFTEYVRGRDSGCEWSDPENDIRKHGKTKIGIYCNDGSRCQNCELNYSPWSPIYGLCKAYTSFVRLLESYLPGPEEKDKIVGFEWNYMVFKDLHFCNDLCVVGHSADGKWSDHYDNGDSVKIDYFNDCVFFHERDIAYVVGDEIWMNEKIISTVQKLASMFPEDGRSPEMTAYSIAENSFYQCDHILQWLKQQYPEMNGFNGRHGMFSMHNFKSNQ